MNTENILKVADAIEKHSIPDLGFNMADVIWEVENPADDQSKRHCGTIACIAGWAIAIEHGAPSAGSALETYMEAGVGMRSAANWLGLDRSDSEDLFFGHGAAEPLSKIQPEQAVRTLRHLAATGEVDWTVVA